MRVGIAMGAVMGSQEMARAQVVSGLPMAANDTKYTRASKTLTGPAALCASSGRERSEGAEHGGVERITEDEPHDSPCEHATSDGGQVDAADGRGRDERSEGGDRNLAKTEQADPGDLPGEEASCRYAGQEHLDDTAGLLFDHSVEHHRAVRRDGHEQQDGHDERGGFVIRGASRDLSEFDAGHGDGGEQAAELRVGDPEGPGAFFDGADLDGGRGEGLELLVGASPPLELAGVDDENVDLSVANGLFTFGDCFVVVDADLGSDRVSLRVDGRGERCRAGAGHAHVLGSARRVEKGGECDHTDNCDDHDRQGRQEGAGPAAFPELTFRDAPSLADAVHAATACRNSSDSVGG